MAHAPAAAAHDWHAPAAWRAIDFVSDLHLGPALPVTAAAFEHYLEATTADALVILGDLFELWVGDDARSLPEVAGLVDSLRRAAARRPLFFMAGNRDFLVGDELAADTGLERLPDPTCLQAFGNRYVLTHGDALCLSDLPYQAFRRQVRDPDWQRGFLAQPLGIRLAIAADVRRQSAQRNRFDGAAEADVDPTAAVEWLDACGARTMIHGHTHRPRSAAIDAAHRRHVLSDWDLDDPARPRAEVSRLSATGLARLAPEAAVLAAA